MKTTMLFFLSMSLAACGQDMQDVSHMEASGFIRPSQSISLNGRQADQLIDLLSSAGVERLDAIESVSWTLTRVKCKQFLLAGSGLKTTCDLGLPPSESDDQGPITRPAKAITLNGDDATNMVQFLSKVVGVLPVSAIKSTVWETKSVICSRSLKSNLGLMPECHVTL